MIISNKEKMLQFGVLIVEKFKIVQRVRRPVYRRALNSSRLPREPEPR